MKKIVYFILFFTIPAFTFQQSNNSYTMLYDSLPAPVFSHSAGFYQSAFYLKIQDTLSSASIYYTNDGSEPTNNSRLFKDSLQITSTVVIKARIINGAVSSKTKTKTYLINESTELPVVSISTDPGNLFDPDSGIYVLGKHAQTDPPRYGANFWEDWERRVHFELFEIDKSNPVSMDAGVKIYGAWSRMNEQKSLAVFARKEYGESSIKHKIFPWLPINKYESIILRNSGNDFYYTMLRDGFMTNLASEVGIDVQAFRPAVVFINGNYWGIHEIREKINEHYIAARYNVNPDSINLLQDESLLIHGDSTAYEALLSFLNKSTTKLSDSVSYEYVKSQIDIDEFINYMTCEIYYANGDWPGNNIKYWNTTAPGSKWRWIMFDTDFGFGLYNPGKFNDLSLYIATSPNGSNYPNPPWSTLFLRKLLENSDFKNAFINRFSDFCNSLFKPEYVIHKLDSLAAIIEGEIERHKSRWGHPYYQWFDELEVIRNFALNRMAVIKGHYKNKFKLQDMTSVKISSDPAEGIVQLNSLKLTSFPWEGNYYKGVPILLKAIPGKGYKFSHWEGINETSRQISVMPESLATITAHFVPDNDPPVIVINEINYNSADSLDSEDWIELHNNGSVEENIAGWILKDEDDSHTWVIPQGVVIPAGGYFVFCSDSTLFKNIYPQVVNYIGNVSFGLSSGGENVRLFNSDLVLMDSVHYDNNAPWPEEPDGKGKTLSLVNPSLNNDLPESWKASLSFGTPGAINDVFSNDVEEDKESLPSEFALEQNYPNPFNPSTHINYVLPKAANITLAVYDVLGRKIKILTSGYYPAGYHTTEFNASGLSSGMYFYRLTIDNNTSFVKKMIFAK